MSGYPPTSPSKGPKKVLLATEKAFAAGAVSDIDKTLTGAGYTLKKLENYKEEQQLLDAIADVDAVIVRSDLVTPKVMDAGKKLTLIVRAGAGYDNIDLPAATGRSMTVMNTPGANANAVAELAFGMMIANARNHWDGSSGWELSGKTIAVYGFGAVARNLHRIAKGFGMKFAAYDPYLTKAQVEDAGAIYCSKVEELFSSQIVSLHCPATGETKNSINYALLSKMPKNAVLVNTARPEVVHEADLKKLLEERKDFAYVSDVPPKNLADLQSLPEVGKRVFVTKKKMGAQTGEANSNAGIQAAQQIVGFFERGEMRGKVAGPAAAPKATVSKTVLLATEKAFAAEAVKDIQKTFDASGYVLKKLENYKEEQQLLDAVADVDAVIIRSDKATAKVMDAGKNLKLIVRAGAGYYNIDLPAAVDRKIITMNTPGANANAVAELAFGMMIANARNHWDGSSGYELQGKTLAVYGFGAVARHLHRIAKGFGMAFSAYDPFLTKEQVEGAGAIYCSTVEELFKSQFVSLHCPLTEKTKDSINYALTSMMPKNAVLVNTARPEVVSEPDLKKIIEERKDFAYVADVPPKTLADLHALPDGEKRVFVTKKKMGAQTLEANSNAGIQAAEQIVGFFERGEMRGQVKP
jgi:D-3-phosphoglycerate dehydrogenase